MSTKNQGLARNPEGEISRTGTRVSLFLPLGVILSSLHGMIAENRVLGHPAEELESDWPHDVGAIVTVDLSSKDE